MAIDFQFMINNYKTAVLNKLSASNVLVQYVQQKQKKIMIKLLLFFFYITCEKS